ncbi:unnamed protein product [Chironomus riparius]|uniref:BTB domain-containing protein n=1 Tax=Chironomus riparius TaxID=315576 RepID=A0A9N9S2L1_9DIPT|nr:unnamed protein product [Chironomus riparius]
MLTHGYTILGVLWPWKYPEMKIPCIFRDNAFLDNKEVYVCEFVEQNIPDNLKIIPDGSHQYSRRGNLKNNIDVTGVIFNKCNLTKVPQGLPRIFPNMKIFSIWNSSLKNVSRNDLAEDKNIEKIGFCSNEIEYLPGDLFEEFYNLEEVSFSGNKLTIIEPNESFKDFHIQIDDQKLPVHKILLAAQSPTFAEILKNNPDVENLNLVDIPVDIFEKILHFLYTDEFPHKETNFFDLFAAAGKLKMEALKDFAAEKIISMINKENAMDILKLSNKYEHKKLKLEAFLKIKKDHPKIDFKDDWIKDVDTVINIIKGYKTKEEAIRKAKEAIEKAEEEFKKIVIKSEKFAN